jgi:cytochrome c556
MKNGFALVIICLVLVMSALYGVAFARGTEMHGEMAKTDMQMHKLHAMMPIFAVASARLKLSLEKGDVTAVAAEAGKILSALPDLKKSQPHKNVNQREKFVEFATNLERTVTTTVSLAKKGDLAGARAAFKKAEETCAACHAIFRD